MLTRTSILVVVLGLTAFTGSAEARVGRFRPVKVSSWYRGMSPIDPRLGSRVPPPRPAGETRERVPQHKQPAGLRVVAQARQAFTTLGQ